MFTDLDELILHIRAAVALPVWAAGGIASQEDVQQVLTAGAEAVVVGTALLRAPESGAQPAHKKALAEVERGQTLITRAFSGRPARALRNDFTDRFTGVAPLGFPAVHHLTSPLRKAAALASDPESLNLWAGTGYRQAQDLPVGDILRRLSSK